MNTSLNPLAEMQAALAEQSRRLAHLAGTGYEMLTSDKPLSIFDWGGLLGSTQLTFDHRTDRTGHDNLYRETLVTRGLESIRGHMETAGYATGEEPLNWMTRILQFITTKSSDTRGWEFPTETRLKLILEFAEVFLRWCSARGAFAHTLFDALAAARFPDDPQAQAMWKKSLIA